MEGKVVSGIFHIRDKSKEALEAVEKISRYGVPVRVGELDIGIHNESRTSLFFNIHASQSLDGSPKQLVESQLQIRDGIKHNRKGSLFF